ncbi:MAG: hypothetical protein LH471_01375 [Salinibacterium sp.]|nr:hypothetical protein [Salinibacterium sp.]
MARRFTDYEELLASDADAIAIFTQRWVRGEMTMSVLQRRKHVYSAVPMGVSIDEIAAITALVASTCLSYSTGEMSYYYPSVAFCRDAWRRSAFGPFVFGEGEYIHDTSHGFYDAFKYSGGEDWKRTASILPMYYPTHSLACVLAVTESYATSVSCVGFVDTEVDGVFDQALLGSFRSEFAPIHDLERSVLPVEFGGMHNGNEGSHQFLVNGYVTACVSGRMPVLTAWTAAIYTVPGLVAHESAVRGGVRLDVPDSGPAPSL